MSAIPREQITIALTLTFAGLVAEHLLLREIERKNVIFDQFLADVSSDSVNTKEFIAYPSQQKPVV